MLPDEIYENMNTEIEDTFGIDGNEENVVDTFENDEHAEEEKKDNNQLESSDDHENNGAKNNGESETVITRGRRIVKPARQAAWSELLQLNKRMVFRPIHREDITK